MVEDNFQNILLTLYKEVNEKERNFSLRKTQLISNGLLGLSILLLVLNLIIKTDIINNTFLSIILLFVVLIMIGMFTLYIIYISVLNKYHRIHCITQAIIEKNLYEYISNENKRKTIKKNFFNLLPFMRLIEKRNLYKPKWWENWFLKPVLQYDEDELNCFLIKKFKKS